MLFIKIFALYSSSFASVEIDMPSIHSMCSGRCGTFFCFEHSKRKSEIWMSVFPHPISFSYMRRISLYHIKNYLFIYKNAQSHRHHHSMHPRRLLKSMQRWMGGTSSSSVISLRRMKSIKTSIVASTSHQRNRQIWTSPFRT